MESELDYYQQNQENKKARQMLFTTDNMGCHEPEIYRCKCCRELFDESDLGGGLCEYCNEQLNKPND